MFFYQRNTTYFLLLVALLLAACQSEADGPATQEEEATIVPSVTATLTQPPFISNSIVTVLPPATAAPAPEATPHVHQVADGETLLGIALQYGLGVDQLIAANSDVNPRFLSVGQSLTIPLANGSGDPIFIANPTPAAITLGPITCLTSATAQKPCIGLLHNTTGTAISNVSVQYQSQDLEPAVAYPELDVIFPNQQVPYVFSVPTLASNVQVTLASAVSAGSANDRFIQLPADTVSITALESTGLVVSSSLQNPVDTVATQVRVAVVAVDAGDQPIGYQLLELPEIAPSSTVPLSAVLTVDPATVERVLISALAVRQES